MYYIYILYSKASNKYYLGYTANPAHRLSQHNTQTHFNTFTAKHRPWSMEALFECSVSEGEAITIERFIKKQRSRRLIEQLIDPGFVPTDALAQLVRVPDVRD
jgi:putative endonuclease